MRLVWLTLEAGVRAGLSKGVWVLLLFGTLSVEAELPALIPREVLFGNQERFSPKISPDGTKLGYLAAHEGVMSVWVKTLGNEAADQVVVQDPQASVMDFFWQADGEHLLYLKDHDGNQNWHIFQTHLPSKNTRDLTAFIGVRAQLIGVNEAFPDQILVTMNLRDRGVSDVYRINLQHGGVLLDTENVGDVVNWVVDATFQVRGAMAGLEDGSTEVRVRNDGRSVWRRVLRWGASEGPGALHGFTADSKGLFIATSLEANATRLLEVDVATGKRKVIVEDPTQDVAGVMVNPATRQLEAVQIAKLRDEWVVLDGSIQAHFDELKRVRNADFLVSNRDRSGRFWVVSYQGADTGGAHYLYDKQTRRSSLLFFVRPAMDKVTLSAVKPVSFTARDGILLQGYLTLPPGVESKNLPTVVVVHAGPWARDSFLMSNEAQWLANRGYAVLQVNYRGSAGFGKAHLLAGDKEWGGKMLDDLVDAKNWAVKEGLADTRRVGIYGASYGGYAVLAALAFAPHEFACGVDLFGPSNLSTLVKSVPERFRLTRAMFERRIGNPESESDFLKSRSPLFKADRITKPLMIAQGALASQTEVEETKDLVAAIKKRGGFVDAMVFEDEATGFSKMTTALKFYGACEQFLAKHLGGRSAPAK